MAKISMSNIAEELAAKNGISREAADSFIHAFITTIKQGLQDDNMVKIKGLGTFKLQEISNRESVDVNTGERITIKGHRKVTFTPDSAMKELVNRPFAHFEPTELNDGYPSEEESIISDSQADENEDIEITEDITTVQEAPTTIVEEIITTADIIEEEAIKEVANTTETVPSAETYEKEEELPRNEEAQPVTKPEEPQPIENIKEEAIIAVKTNNNTKKKFQGRHRYGWSILLVLIIAAVGTYYWYTTTLLTATEEALQDSAEEFSRMKVNPNLAEELGTEWANAPEQKASQATETSKTQVGKKPEQAEQPMIQSSQAVPAKAQSAITKPTKTTPNAESSTHTVALTQALEAKELKDITLADTTEYAIAGTLTTHKLRNGETIILLAKKYYGDKRLWPYIVKHNKIHDFNKVAIGQTINIPMMKKVATE